MRGAVLAFPDQDRSHTCSVRDPPPQLCIDRKAVKWSLRNGVVTSSISPLIPDMLWCPGVGVGAGRVRITAEQLQCSDQIYLLGNSSDDFTVAKEAPRSIKHFR
ncbi:unnamed protein product [Victoria cruziana]